MIIALRILVGLALLFNAWIIFRVVHDWAGLLGAIASLVLFPVSIVLMPIAMLFIPSTAAGPWALWPAMVLILILQKVAEKRGKSLLLG